MAFAEWVTRAVAVFHPDCQATSRTANRRSQRWLVAAIDKSPCMAYHHALMRVVPPIFRILRSIMPKIIDLFAGAGGLSLGAARAGFEVSAAVELDSFAAQTHTTNFPNSIHICTDITSLTGAKLLSEANLRAGEVDGLIGGPPCQGFSTIGKRDENDRRNDLFGHFFRLVSEVRPAFFLAENVPGILDQKYDGIRNRAFLQLRSEYRLLDPLIVKANLYGAPTTRTRIFFIGYRPGKFKRGLSIEEMAPASDVEATTVGKALAGLPQQINSGWITAADGWRPIESRGTGKYFERIQNAVPNGIGEPLSLARYLERGFVSGCMGTRHTPDVIRRFEALAHGEKDWVSKAIRLDPNGYCPTLRAGTAKDKGSFQAVRPIHFDSPRVITPREAARLQGFPDWFVFHDTKWHSFRQIGNSVSPIVAEDILKKVFQNMTL
ncbi:Modification methylase BanI [Azoarcus sp. Aa7]|nr:Modification methylase BanI [Azoarcus sp. Aa7]